MVAINAGLMVSKLRMRSMIHRFSPCHVFTLKGSKRIYLEKNHWINTNIVSVEMNSSILIKTYIKKKIAFKKMLIRMGWPVKGSGGLGTAPVS